MNQQGLNVFLIVFFSVAVGCIEKVERTNNNVADSLSTKNQPYEMRTYYLVLLRRGPNWTAESTPQLEELQKQHLAHINSMAESGDLILAGPFMEQSGDSALAGLFIFKVESFEDARLLTESDPAVKAGRLVYELYPWYGPSTLSY